MPKEQRLELPFAVRYVLYRHPHHAAASGYDRLCDFVGEELQLSPVLYYAGETLLRPWALLDAKFGGQFEYSRYDWVLERALMIAMRRAHHTLFHVLYGEKNFRHAWKLAGINGNKLVATLHHPPEHFEWLFRSTRHFRFLSHAIVMSAALKEYAETLVGKGRVSVVPYGVDVNYFTPIARPRSDATTIVFAGFHERDYAVLAQVVEVVVKGHDGAQFVMISKDPRCEEIARRFPTRAKRLAQLGDDDYRATLQTSDMMVLPLRHSVACTAVLEAMACGVPVLTTAGGVSEYIGQGGALFPPGEVAEMADTTLHLIRNRDLLTQMQRAARAQALKFAWPVVARHTADVYRALMRN